MANSRLGSLVASRRWVVLQVATFAIFLITLAVSVAMVHAHMDCAAYHRSASVNGKVEIAALACAIALSVARGLAQLWLRRGRQALLTVAVFAAQALVSVAAIRTDFNITLGYCNPCFPLGCGDLDGLSPCLLGCAH